jgi:5-methyltetrahydrofolate--homocysteine methyltransferase
MAAPKGLGALPETNGMKYKPDWDEAKARLTALWNGEALDRACLSVTAGNGKKMPAPSPRDAEARWMDPDYVIPTALATIENQWWGGESIPSYLLMGGWVINAGARPQFHMNTIWFDPAEGVDFNSPPDFRVDPANPWIARFEDLYRRTAAAAGWDDFLIGQPCILPAADVMAFHMGTEPFLEALALHPDWIEAALRQLNAGLMAERRRLKSLIEKTHAFWYGSAGWMPFWAPRPYISTQSDVSCMISPDMFERFVAPELEAMGNEAGGMWYHLDGYDAKQHLPRLLSMPFLRVIQYVPTPSEPPNGMGQLELYKTIQAAGRIVHVVVPPEEVAPLMKALDPALLLLQTRVASPAAGEAMLASLPRQVGR